MKTPAPNAILIVVSNPLDAMVYVAKQVTGFPRERVIGSAGILDSARFRTYIAMAAGASVEDVNAIVLGAHTDKDMVPIVSHGDDRRRSADKFLSAEKLTEVVENTKKGGATLTGLIGTWAWLAPGAGTCLMVEASSATRAASCPARSSSTASSASTGAFVGVPGQADREGRRERSTSSSCRPPRRTRSRKSVAANTELMNIARGFLG